MVTLDEAVAKPRIGAAAGRLGGGQVGARTEAAAGAGQNDCAYRWLGSGFSDRGKQARGHVEIDGIEHIGPVQCQGCHAPRLTVEHCFGHCFSSL